MSEAQAADLERELDEIADRLYALRPDEFAAARDEAIRKARADKNQALARELGQLRKPTQSAWLINLLWRDQQEVMEQLFELSEELSRAQAQSAGSEMRSLTAQRRELESALLRQARALGEQAGVKVTDAMAREAQETLGAALASSEVADEVRTGRLVKPAAYAGFGFDVAAPPRPASRSSPPAPARRPARDAQAAGKHAEAPADAAEAPPPKADEIAARAAQRARQRREEAEARVADARAAMDDAAATLSEHELSVEKAQRREHELRGQLKDLREQLNRLEDEVAAAEHTTLTAARRRDQAEAAREAAERTLERAQEYLQELEANAD